MPRFRPVIVSKQSSATFADKEQIWADNAESSRFFGNVYVCYAAFRGSGAAPLVVSTSSDGGSTWATKQVSPAHNVAPTLFGQSGCTIRTDSRGTAYVFYDEFQDPTKPSVGFPPAATHKLVQSSDGGRSWTKPRTIQRVTDSCFFVDPVIARCVMDGVAGARSDPRRRAERGHRERRSHRSGRDRLHRRDLADGRDGLNNEDVMVSWSSDRGGTFSSPRRVSSAPDRGFYAAPALSPDGTDLYVVYNAITTPFRSTTATPRSLVGVVKHAGVAGGAPGAFTQLHRGASGDPRGSSQNNLQAEFLGDYVYAAATRTYAAAVWNEARNAADCPAMDAFRQALQDGAAATPPAVQQACPARFGNTDIFAWSGADPTP